MKYKNFGRYQPLIFIFLESFRELLGRLPVEPTKHGLAVPPRATPRREERQDHTQDASLEAHFTLEI
jgi:hypothetical protein